jgi:hypothetical protein
LNHITSTNVFLDFFVISSASFTGSHQQVSFQSLTSKIIFLSFGFVCFEIISFAFFSDQDIGVHPFGDREVILDLRDSISLSQK